MAVNLSIKNVPDELADRLRKRAARNHRSVQGELMAIVEAAATESDPTITGVSETYVEYRDQRPETRAKSTAKGRTMATVQAMNDAGHIAKVPLRWPSEAARLVRDSRDLDANFEETSEGWRRMRTLNASEILARMRALDIRTPGSAAEIVRRMRDERHG